jgi:hypothetical protein
MYRDETAAHRQRLDEASDDVRAAWREAQAELSVTQALNAKLDGREPGGVEAPPVTPPRPCTEPDPSATSAELLALCAAQEREAKRLREDVARLRRVNRVLDARDRGVAVRLSLGPPPRRVPTSYLFGQWLGFSPMVIVFGGLLGVPFLVAFGVASAWAALVLSPLLLGSLVLLFVLARAKVHFLRRCREGTNVRVVSTSSGSSSYTNWPLPVARGWKVKHESYTGHAVKTSLAFATEEGQEGTAELSGAPYADGVVLYDPKTLRGFCVSQLRCAPHPDEWGDWKPGLSWSIWLRSVLTVAIVAAALAAPLLAHLG